MFTLSKTQIYKLKRIRNEFCDATIIAENGAVFSAHKCLLAMHSHFFSKLFKYGSQNDNYSLSFPSYTGLRNVLLWIYEHTLEQQHLLDTIVAADYLCCPEIYKVAKTALKSQITDENVVSTMLFSRAYSLRDLEEHCWKYVEYNFHGVSQTEDFSELSFEDLRTLLNSDTLNVSREIEICKSVSRWIQYEPESRRPHAKSLFECLRHSELYEDLCTDFLHLTKGDQKTSGDCPINAATFQSLVKNVFIDMPSSFQFNQKTPRCWSNSLIVSGGWMSDVTAGINGPCNVVESFDMRQNVWHNLGLADPLGSRCYFGMVFLPPKFIYFIGGTRNSRHRAEVNRLNLATKTYENVAPMQNRRCFLSTALINGKILAIGGHNGILRLSSVEIYDPERDEWSLVQSLNQVRSDAGAASFGSKVYIAGGFNGHRVLSTVECYDPNLDEWTFLPNLNTGRSGNQLVEAGGYLFCLGGFDGSDRLSTCERFSFETRRWDIIQSMNTARSNFASSVIGDKIIVCGGFLEPSPISCVEYYDINKNSWTSLAPLSAPRSALSMVIIPDMNINHPEFGPPLKPDLPAEVVQSHLNEYDNEPLDIACLFDENF